MTGGTGHPLPGSDEARHNEIPEKIEREKGRGDDKPEVATPDRPAVNPDGEPYRYDDLGRGDGGDKGLSRTDRIRNGARA